MMISLFKNRICSCVLLWILTFFQWNINGFLFQEVYPEMEPKPDAVFQVNHSVIISCKIMLKKNISLYLNNTLLQTSVSEIKYPFKSERPGVYNFLCKCKHAEASRSVTFRYAPRVTSSTPLITSLDYCHMIVEFGLDHFTKRDYISIDRYDNERKSFKSCSNGSQSCEFTCSSNLKYTFQVKLSAPGLNVLTFNRTIFASFKFYKPDKINLTVSAKGRESLNLTYGIKETNNNDRLIKQTLSNWWYRIFYKSQWNQTQKVLISNKREIQLEHLVPYTNYTIDVQARLNESIYWSDKVTLTEKTLPSAPYAGPNSTNGSYSETKCVNKSKRCFILYWAMIPMPLRNGIFESYVIQQDEKTLLETSEICGQINDQPKNKDLWFEIRAQNNNSQLSPPTIIHIPPEAPKSPEGVSIVKLNNSHVEIYWALKQSLENVNITVMSCLGEKTGSSSWCKSDVMWTPKIQNKNFIILKTVDVILAAVYVSNSKGSSSLTFAECVLSGGIAKQPSMPIIKASPHQLILLWPKFSCNELNGRPTLFQVLYSEGNNCSNGPKMNISAIVTRPETENIHIKNLKPFTNYSVCLRIRTVQGWSLLSPQKRISTIETNPSSGVRNLKIVDITSSNVTLRWDPTLQPNGIITNQFIYYERSAMNINSSDMATVSGLNSFTKYNFQVSTCNKGGCSAKSKSVSATTLYDAKLIWVIFCALISCFLIIVCCVFCMKNLKKKCEQTNFSVKFPDGGCENDSCALPESPNLSTKSDWISNGQTSNGYITIGSDSLTDLIDCKNDDSSSAEHNQHLINFANDNKYNSNSSKALEMADLSELSTNLHEKKEVYPQRNLPSAKSCPDNDYIRQENINISKMNQSNSDSNHHGNNNIDSPELSLTNLDSNVNIPQIKSSEMCQDNSDSNYNNDGYISKSESSLTDNLIKSLQTASDPNQFLSKLNQACLDSNGYIQNDMKSSKLSQANLNSNGYICNNMSSSETNQVNSNFNGYVTNDMNSSETSQANSNSNGYVTNDISSSETNQVNSNFNGYVSNDMNSSETSQANSNSNGYVTNDISSSETNQVNSNFNGYVSNDINSSELSQTNSNSNGSVSNNMSSSKLNQANPDCNSSFQNYRNSSDLSLANSDHNKKDDWIASSEFIHSRMDSNGYVQNMNSFELNQTNMNSNSHGENYIASRFNQANSDHNVHFII